ncbi:MAG: glycosyltransferase [Lachnospira sp.]
MKNVIMFRGGVETLEFFSVEISSYLTEQGYNVIWYNLLLEEISFHSLMDYYEKNKEDEFITFTFNFEGIAGEKGLYQGYDNVIPENTKWNFWDYANVKVYNMVVDHPLYYHKYIAMRPKNYYQIDIDRQHVDYMKRFFPEVENVMFVPLGGTELNLEGRISIDSPYMAIKERPIDVIFTGNFTPKRILRKHLNNMEQEYIDFYENALERLIHNPDKTIDELAMECLKEQFPHITDLQLRECMPNMMYVDLAVRFHYRELAVKALADSGIKIHTYGAGFNMMNLKHPENIIENGGVNSGKCLDMISQSKISLNIMPWFKRGIHDRILNSCLNGAVSLTDSSEMIEELFKDDHSIILYDLKMLRDYEKSGYDEKVVSQMTDRVKNLLESPDKLQSIADNAYNLCHNKHSWRERAEQIFKEFD